MSGGDCVLWLLQNAIAVLQFGTKLHVEILCHAIRLMSEIPHGEKKWDFCSQVDGFMSTVLFRIPEVLATSATLMGNL